MLNNANDGVRNNDGVRSDEERDWDTERNGCGCYEGKHRNRDVVTVPTVPLSVRMGYLIMIIIFA